MAERPRDSGTNPPPESAPPKRVRKPSALPKNIIKELNLSADVFKTHRETLERGHMMKETPPEAWEEFGREAEAAKAKAEAYGYKMVQESPASTAVDVQKLEAEANDEVAKQNIAGRELPKETPEETPTEAWEETLGKLKEAQDKANPPQETPPHEWEKFAREAEEAKKKAEAYGFEVRRSPEMHAAPPKKVEEAPKAEIWPEAKQQEALQELEKLAGLQRQRIEAEAAETKSKSIIEKVKDLGDAYNRLPIWKKVALGGGLMVLGIPGGSLLQKVISGVGMFAVIDGATQNLIKNRLARATVAAAGAALYAVFASQIFSALDQKLGVSEAIRGWWLGGAPAVPTPDFPEPPRMVPAPPSDVNPPWTHEHAPLTSEWPPVQPPHVDDVLKIPDVTPPWTEEHAPITSEWPPVQSFGDEPPKVPDVTPPWTEEHAPITSAPAPEPTPEVPAPAAELFGTAVVARGDTLWGIIERQLAESEDFAGLDRAQKDFMIDAHVKALNIPNKDLLAVGQQIDLSSLNDQTLQDNTLSRAQSLTDAEKRNILRFRLGR